MKQITQFPMPGVVPMIRASNCGNCKHSVKVNQPQLECHGEPPKAQLFPVQGGGFVIQTFYPMVNPDAIPCAQWKIKIEVGS